MLVCELKFSSKVSSKSLYQCLAPYTYTVHTCKNSSLINITPWIIRVDYLCDSRHDLPLIVATLVLSHYLFNYIIFENSSHRICWNWVLANAANQVLPAICASSFDFPLYLIIPLSSEYCNLINSSNERDGALEQCSNHICDCY